MLEQLSQQTHGRYAIPRVLRAFELVPFSAWLRKGSQKKTQTHFSGHVIFDIPIFSRLGLWGLNITLQNPTFPFEGEAKG